MLCLSNQHQIVQLLLLGLFLHSFSLHVARCEIVIPLPDLILPLQCFLSHLELFLAGIATFEAAELGLQDLRDLILITISHQIVETILGPALSRRK